MQRWFGALLLGLVAGHSLAASPSDEVARVAGELSRFNADDLETDVPSDAIPLLDVLKDTLLAVVEGEVAEGTLQGRSAGDLRAAILARLAASGVTVGDEPAGYGAIDDIEVTRPDGNASLIAVATTIGIACGADTSLYLFDERPGGVRLVLSLVARDYTDISGAQNLLDFAVSRADDQGHFFVAASDVNAWCTSSWQRIRLRILRPGDSAETPRVIGSMDDGIYLGSDEPERLAIDGNVVTLDYVGAHRLDAARLTRSYVRRYRVEEDRTTLEGPLADSPDGFVDEWLHRPWSDVAVFTAAGKGRLRSWHDRLRKVIETYPTEVDVEDAGVNRWWV
ncbi:MAG: hypothetical protein U0166_15285, partial [Acidobacteriota bacterium]